MTPRTLNENNSAQFSKAEVIKYKINTPLEKQKLI